MYKTALSILMKYLLILSAIINSYALFAQYETPVFMNVGDDLQLIINANPDSTLYIIKEGTHRLQRIIPKDGDILIGEPGAILNGSFLLEDWEFDGTYWTHHIPVGGDPGWDVNIFPDRGWPVDSSNNGCRYMHSLFIDDNPMYREDGFSGLNNLPDTLGWFTYWAGPGMVDTTYGMVVEPFYGDWNYDDDENTIYTLTDPTGHKMELTSRVSGAGGALYAIWGKDGAKNVTVRGLVVEKYASTWGAVTYNTGTDPSSFWQIDNNDLIRNHRFALVGTGNAFIRGNKMNHNGWSSFILWGAEALSSGKRSAIDNNEMAYNNYLRSNDGSKAILCNGLNIRNNHNHHNWTNGLWCDNQNKNIRVEGNYVHDNTGVGIFHEISDTAIIRCNRLENNRHRYRIYAGQPDFTQSLYISTSMNVEVSHNYIRQDSTGRALIVEQTPRTDNGILRCAQNVNVHDNIIFNNAPPAYLPIAGLVVDPSTIGTCGFPENITFDNNAYHIPQQIQSNWDYFYFRDTLTADIICNFSEFQGYGFETDGVFDNAAVEYEKPAVCEDIPAPFIVQSRLFLNCKMNASNTAMEAADLTQMPYFQPFSEEPYYYFEKDVCPKLPNQMVDWVLLQIRDASNIDEVLKQKAAILLTDGRIVDPYPSFLGVAQPGDTLDGVVFYDLIPNQEYRLSVITRQQTMAMASSSTLLPNMAHYDFTNPNAVQNIADFEQIGTDLIALNSISVSIQASTNSICIGDSVELSAIPNLLFDNEPSLIFNWENGLANEDSLVIWPTQTTTYAVELTDEIGCSTFDEIEISVYPIPDLPSISGAVEVLAGSEETYQITNANLTSDFEWVATGGSIISDSNNEINVMWNGVPPFEICAVETTAFGCKGEENCLPIEMVSSSNDLLLAQKIVLYPNPSSGKIFIKHTESIDVFETTIFDSKGIIILNSVLLEMDMMAFPKGVYYVQINSNKGTLFKKITIL